MSGIAWLHGYTMRSSIFEPLWDQLPDRKHVGIDLPGHGTAAAEPMADLPTTAANVAARLERDGIRTLVGLSFGSCVALQVALDHPHTLDALVLAAPTLAGTADDPAARGKYLILRRLYLLGVRGQALADIWMSDPPAIFTGLRPHGDAFARMRDTVAQHPFTELTTGAMGSLGGTVHADADLAGLKVATLVIIGTADMPRFAANARRLAACSALVETESMDGAGHLPLLEEPSRSAASIRSFLDARRAPATAGLARS